MTISEIKSAITQLTPQELAELMAWLQKQHARRKIGERPKSRRGEDRET